MDNFIHLWRKTFVFDKEPISLQPIKSLIMLRQEEIATAIDTQLEDFKTKGVEINRESLNQVPIADNFATIITGLRRCGKSTLLLQLLHTNYKEALYLNFEDIRLAGFEVSDFIRLHAEIKSRAIKVLFFDEVQTVIQWERFVHQLLREGYTVFVTGSNASLLSKELGTSLTGRHLSMELFPFSYREFTQYKAVDFTAESLHHYLITGGIPEYVKTGIGLIINNLLNDILIRDIAVRYTIRDVNSLRQLAVYLLTNVGNLVSANKLVGMFGIKSSTTILEFFSYYRDAYLIEFMPQFSYSMKAQARNPKKIYAMDTGLITEVSVAFTDNMGHRFENLIYLHLRRYYTEIYYFTGKGECDFVAFKQGKADLAVQVCYQIEDLNFEREYNGLIEAMIFFKLTKGVIITQNQHDVFEKEGLTVQLIPAYQWLSQY